MGRPLLLVLSLVLYPALSCAAQSEAAEPQSTPSVTITYLANEGVLIEGDGKRIAIDALHRPYGNPGDYLHLPDEERARFEAAEPPYDGLDLILVTHVHRDHFHPEAVGSYLLAHPGTTVVSSQQVVESIMESDGRPEVARPLRQVNPEVGKSITKTEVGIQLTLLGLKHSSKRFEWIQNLGYLVEVGGKKILHIGDADMNAGNFDSLNLPAEKIDVALIPAWFFLYPEGQYALRRLITAKQWVAIHVPPNRSERYADAIARPFPEAVVFTEPGQVVTVE